MSKEAAANFFKKLKSDPALMKRVQAMTDVAEITAVAKASGFDFTDSEYKAAARAHGGDSLSDQALEAVAGGMDTISSHPAGTIKKPVSSGC